MHKSTPDSMGLHKVIKLLFPYQYRWIKLSVQKIAPHTLFIKKLQVISIFPKIAPDNVWELQKKPKPKPECLLNWKS